MTPEDLLAAHDALRRDRDDRMQDAEDRYYETLWKISDKFIEDVRPLIDEAAARGFQLTRDGGLVPLDETN